MMRPVPDPDTPQDLQRAGDALLVARAQDGDRRAFALLLRRHERTLRRYAHRLVRNDADVDDVLQETALIAWRRLDALDDPERIRAWLIRITTREALRFAMARPSHDELTDDLRTTEGSDVASERADLYRALQIALDALPQQQARCWVLRELGGYTYREIAEQLDVPESTVRGNLAQARKSILSRMGGLR